MTLGLVLLAVVLFFISEVFGDFFPLIQDRFRVAGGIVVFFLAIWLFSAWLANAALVPEPLTWGYWMQHRIVIEKCQLPC